MIKPPSDNKLIRYIKNRNCSDSLQELIKRHSAIVAYVAKRYVNKGLSLQDVLDEKDYLIYLAAQEYKPRKSKFSTYLANSVRFFCLKRLKKNSRFNFTPEFDWNTLPTFDDNDENTQYLLSLVNQIKDKRVQKIFEMRYFLPKKANWQVIGDKLSMSKQQAINLHNKTLRLLKNKLTSTIICDTL